MRRGLRRVAIVATTGLLAIAIAIVGAVPSSAAGSRSLDEIRAAFLYRFLFYLRDAPAHDPDGRMCLGVLGASPLTSLLEEVDGRLVRGRRVEVRGFRAPGEIDSCEVVFISPELDGGVEPAARALADRSVLTVSTASGFARSGGMIELAHDDGRIRFDVNNGVARASGVQLNAELLQVARRVYR